MNTHKRIIAFSIFILILSIAILIIGYQKEYVTINFGNIILYIVLIIWCISFPYSLYTCYRMIGEDTIKGSMISRIIRAVYGGILGGVFLIPFLIGPFFIVDYIRYIKIDYIRDKFES